MNYVISDIHGYYEKYIELLEKFKFSDSDTLYILGDIIDRGPEPMKIIKDIMKRENVVYLAGNHEYLFLHIVAYMGVELNAYNCDKDIIPFYNLWCEYDGGVATRDDFLKLTIDERKQIVEYMKEAVIYEELEIDGKNMFWCMREFKDMSLIRNWMNMMRQMC